MHDEMREPTEEEMRAALEEQMRRIRVEDVILQTVATLVNLAGRRLGLAAAPGEDPGEERDLDQAKLAIDAARALAPMCPEDEMDPIRQALSQLQMAFAREAQVGGVPIGQGGEPGQSEPRQAQPGREEPAEDDERARARAKLWTPPGV